MQVCVLASVCGCVCVCVTPPVVFIQFMWYSALTSLILFFPTQLQIDLDSQEAEGNFRPFVAKICSKIKV